MRRYIFIIWLLASGVCVAQNDTYHGKIQTVNIINWTHTDYGYTDHPLIVFELHKRYIDIALDYAEQTKNNKPGERFCWTVESLDPFWRWWQETTPDRRKKMTQAIRRGQIDVNIMPFNIHPMLNETEIQKLLSWAPADIVAQVNPRVAIQCDVNGFQRAIASELIDKGIKYVWMSMNGHRVYNIPAAHWWEMPDGRRIFLWNSDPYWEGYEYFHPKQWRNNIDEYNSLETLWPREGEIFKADEASVRKTHEYFLQNLKDLEAKGYSYELLPVTFSNQWRCDNDGPYPAIVSFVKKWNELGLKPVLRLTTVTASVEAMERIAGPDAPVVKGEFFDWWAFGLMAMPRETAIARNARYTLQAAQSPVFGSKMTANQLKRIDEIERDICTYYEHTFAANSSSWNMWGEQNQGTMNEVYRYAYKADEYARWILAQKSRSAMKGKPGGIYLINTQKADFSGWRTVKKRIIIDVSNPKSLIDQQTGKKVKLYDQGDNFSFWADRIKGESIRHYVVSTNEAEEEAVDTAGLLIETNASGWPVSIRWKGMKRPLFEGEAPLLYVSRFISGNWWDASGIPADYVSQPLEKARVTETPFTVVYSQKLDNQRLNAAERILTIYKNEKRVNVKIIYDRILHTEQNSEVIYAEFPFPNVERQVTSTHGGMAFTPYSDNIPNTCKSNFIADDWVKFTYKDGTIVWSSKTSPIFELGKHVFFLGGDIQEPHDSNLLQSMIYNNAWTVNFQAEYSGKTECEYDVYWTPDNPGIQQTNEVTDAYIVKPILIVNPDMEDFDLYNKWLNGY